jgi:cytosine/uracil/thiamine/allantoin permease
MDIGTINNNSSLTALAHLSAFGGFVGFFVCGIIYNFWNSINPKEIKSEKNIISYYDC